MSEKTCRKCGHVATYSGMEPQSCMECGAVYRKVEEAMQQASEGRFSQLPRASVSAQLAAGRGGERRPAVAGVHGFAEQMRSDSLYPFWRKLVGIATVLGYVLAGFMMVGAVVTLFRGAVGAGIGGMVAAALIAFMVRMAKELWLMLADLSDASMRIAARAAAGD